MYSIYYCRTRICGAKLIRIHMQNHQLVPADLIQLFPNARFIILYRKNVLEQYLSLKVAEMTDSWGMTNNFKLPSSVPIDREELAEYCQMVKGYYEGLVQDPCLKDRSILLDYEELATEAQAMFDRVIFPFLGLPSTPVSSSLQKQTTKKPSQIIKNYEEIKDFDREYINFEKDKSKMNGHFQISFSRNGHHAQRVSNVPSSLSTQP